MRNKKQKKNQKSQKNKRNTKLKKLQERKIKSSGLNEKNTTNKVGNQEKILRIVQMYFITGKEKNIMTEISYWTKILEDYVNKEKPLRKVGNELMTFIKENKKKIRKMDIYSDKETQTKKERDNVKDL